VGGAAGGEVAADSGWRWRRRFYGSGLPVGGLRVLEWGLRVSYDCQTLRGGGGGAGGLAVWPAV
jgi:hypothetical protein